MEDGSLLLGTIELAGKKLTLGVNSDRRLERARALIEPVLAGLVGEPKILTETLSQFMASEPLLPPDEERRITQAALERHYRETLDSPIPVLGNLSPVTPRALRKVAPRSPTGSRCSKTTPPATTPQARSEATTSPGCGKNSASPTCGANPSIHGIAAVNDSRRKWPCPRASQFAISTMT